MSPDDYAAKATDEHGHQVAVFMWAALEVQRHPELALLYAIPNGGQRNVIVAGRLKAEGVKAGFPDIGLPVARQGYHGLFIELKRPATDGKAKGALQANQRDFWHPRLMAEGYLVQVIYGFINARACLRWYLGIE